MRGTWSSFICNGYGSEVTKVCYDKEKDPEKAILKLKEAVK